jgi:hypothetical protein
MAVIENRGRSGDGRRLARPVGERGANLSVDVGRSPWQSSFLRPHRIASGLQLGECEVCSQLAGSDERADSESCPVQGAFLLTNGAALIVRHSASSTTKPYRVPSPAMGGRRGVCGCQRRFEFQLEASA